MKKSLLIVDDEFGLADLVAELLIEHGYEAAIAINGQHGLSSMAAKRPDLVILDVMMPIMGGPEMLRIMRATPAYASIPVIMMTALPEALPKDDPPLYQAVLYKPFMAEDLFLAIKRLLDGAS